MPMSIHHTWHVTIHNVRSMSGRSSIVIAINEFRASGFTIAELPVSRASWTYSLQHSNKHAMTLHMLRSEANNFTVTSEWHNA